MYIQSVLVQCFKMYLTFVFLPPSLSLLSLSLLSLSPVSLLSLSLLSLSLLSLSLLSLSLLSLSPVSLLSLSSLSLSCLYLRALFIRLRTSGAIIRSIGDVLQEHIPKLTPHIRWCSCQLTACTLLQSKSLDPSFREYEQACLKDPRTKGLPLSSFLLKPMQRVTKYPLLIGKVILYMYCNTVWQETFVAKKINTVLYNIAKKVHLVVKIKIEKYI